MRVPNNLERSGVGFNMTPMIDIVFLLIIFFLLSSHLARQEVQQELKLPVAESGARPEEDSSRRVVVNVEANGRVTLSGRVVSPGEFGRLLAFERNHAGDDLEVRIRSDQQTPYEAVEPLMLACAKAGVWNVTFAVTRRGN